MAEKPNKLDQQALSTHRPEQREVQDGKILRISKAIAIALIAVSPQLSCAADMEDEGRASDEITSVENAQFGKGNADLAFHRKGEWRFNGNYPEDLRVQIFATDVDGDSASFEEKDAIFDNIIEIDENGEFNIEGSGITDETAWVSVKAYKSSTGEELVISGQPGEEGLYGNHAIANPNNL